MQVFNQILKNPKNTLEFYINYDCAMQHENIVERMVDILGKISQGKYNKAEYMAIIQPPQEKKLRFLALESFVELMKALSQFVDDCKSEKEKPAQPMKKEDEKIEDELEMNEEEIKTDKTEGMDSNIIK